MDKRSQKGKYGERNTRVCHREQQKPVVEGMVRSYQHNVDTPWLYCELRARMMAPWRAGWVRWEREKGGQEGGREWGGGQRGVEERRNEIEMELPEVADGPAAFRT